jgi:thiamine biosynthesis protein ThiI
VRRAAGEQRYAMALPCRSTRVVGHYLLEKPAGLTVDVHRPQTRMYIEIRDTRPVFRTVDAVGGQCRGHGRRALVLLSGGIESRWRVDDRQARRV